MEIHIGTTITKVRAITHSEEYVEIAKWCNANNAHIEDKGSYYEVVANPPAPEPTIQEQVEALERQYNMYRWEREGILAQGSGYSDYTKAKAQEIEDLAQQLRPTEE